jgi:hypothetical protein
MKLPILTATLILATSIAQACDLCACELPAIRLVPKAGWHGGFSEQYTDYGRLQDAGRGIANPGGQYMHSSITQIYAGYDFTDTLGVQLNIPYIARTFRRAEEGAIESGNESGFGDVSLIGSWTAVHIERGDFRFTARVNGGIKLPTGDSSRLKEEGHHGEEGREVFHVIPASPEISQNVSRQVYAGTVVAGGNFIRVFRTVTEKVILRAARPEQVIVHEHEEETPSGVHGHDLALGTGSIDGVFGADFHCQWKRAFFDAGLQFTLRGNGRHDYDYADDVSWHAGGGVVLLENAKWNAALGVRFSGETKGEDDFRGERLDDTSINTVYVGPRLAVTWDEKLSANVGVDFPIQRENSGIQTVPEYRVQAGVNWQF